MNIHPYLLARLYAIQEAFAQTGPQSAFVTNNGNLLATPNASPAKKWQDLVEGGDDKKGGTGTEGDSSGGTIKGLRGKHAESAKAAMRKMTRR